MKIITVKYFRSLIASGILVNLLIKEACEILFFLPPSFCSSSCFALASFLPLGLNYTIKNWQGGGTLFSLL